MLSTIIESRDVTSDFMKELQWSQYTELNSHCLQLETLTMDDRVKITEPMGLAIHDLFAFYGA